MSRFSRSRRSSIRAASIGSLALILGISARADDRVLAVPVFARSIEVVRSGATVRALPDARSARRGTVRVGTKLPFEARVLGQGCPGGEWYRLGAERFVCETLVVPSAAEPSTEVLPEVPPGQLLPRTYGFVTADGTLAYSRPSDYFNDDWSSSLGRGFGLAIIERTRVDGVDFARGLSGMWVAVSDLRFARGSEFEGVVLENGVLDVVWTRRANVPIRESGRGRVALHAGTRQTFRVRGAPNTRELDVVEGRIARRDVHHPRLSQAPEELSGLDEVWIDIDLREQTLVVYRGPNPIFATLISSGRAAHATPVGTHRIWVKLAEDTMDDLDRTDLESNYAIEAVPWVQYFAEGIAIHAAFWHDDFGHPRSHGCINVSPRDARRLFAMTAPSLPPGWDAILTTERERGTLVRVR